VKFNATDRVVKEEQNCGKALRIQDGGSEDRREEIVRFKMVAVRWTRKKLSVFYQDP
jgi:hypothetical protein